MIRTRRAPRRRRPKPGSLLEPCVEPRCVVNGGRPHSHGPDDYPEIPWTPNPAKYGDPGRPSEEAR